MTEPIRVRTLLNALNSVEKAALKKLLPPKLSVPEEPEKVRYPTGLLSILPAGEQYSLAGWITEEMLRYPPAEITALRLQVVASKWCPTLTPEALAKIMKSKTTEPYLAHLRETRRQLKNEAIGELHFDAEVGTGGPVVGHPDMRTDRQIYEVKMTGQLKQNWPDFLLQVFSYAALAPEVAIVYLVLPLQEIVWAHDVRAWSDRDAFRAALYDAAAKKDTTSEVAIAARALIDTCCIGSHMPKLRSLVATVQSLPVGRPYQIFLAGPQTSRLQIADEELALTRAAIALTNTKLYIHSPYLINLCTPADKDDGFHTALLIKNLQYAVAAGARGVVVHVGKSTTQELGAAMATMRANVATVLAYATPECPLLLETPAGQGTEVLRTWDTFAAFVADFADPRLRVCVDTCHVFACGADPLDYVQRFLDDHPDHIKLIHFNDSATACGSCLDRHAFCGQGHIGIAKMTDIAATATVMGIPLIIE
jgi:deoxyribonuclease-4